MRVTRSLMLFLAVAVTAGGCAQRSVMVAAVPPQGIDNVIYGNAPAAPVAGPAVGRGFGSSGAAFAIAAAPPPAPAPAPAYRPPPPPPVPAPVYAAPAPTYAAPPAPSYAMAAPAYGYGGVPLAGRVAAPVSYTYGAPFGAAFAPPLQYPYTLDSGDRLRVVVFGQDGLTNSYVVDASSQIQMPLIGSVVARGLTSDQLSARIADMLRQGFVREPHVAVEVEAYRPFFILGEVAQPANTPTRPT